MTISTAKKIVDWVLLQPIKYPAVIWEFIGGEPLLDVNLINHITDYIILRMTQTKHPWLEHSRFSMATNGTLFGRPEVRDYLMGYNAVKSVTLSLDGVKEIHEENRPGSFNEIMKNFRWWREHFPYDVIKSTLSHNSLPYLFDSVKFFVDGLKVDTVLMNPVFEDVWQDGDEDIYYEQLIKCADFLLENQRYQNKHISLFNEAITKDAPELVTNGWCGCGNGMLAFDFKGNIYPCVRFKTLQNKEPYVIGNIANGINTDLQTPFCFYHNFQDSECAQCEDSQGCARCLAYDYDCTGTILKKTKNICKLHLKRREANKYFFDKIAEIEMKG